MTEHLTDVDQLPFGWTWDADARTWRISMVDMGDGLLAGYDHLAGYYERRLIEEIQRLRTALTGVSTCSTCEACRGAALRALGGETACVHPFTKLGIDGDGVMWCTECQTKPLVIPTPWRDAETTGEGAK